MEKEKKSSSSKCSSRKLPGLSSRNNQGKEEEDPSSLLVGRIVEKGFSTSDPQKKLPTSSRPPKPTVLPFPVARHRSHGPHWAPVVSEMDVDSDTEDQDDTDFNPIAHFANPIKRKQKKSLDFSRWRELVPQNSSSITEDNRMDNSTEVALVSTQGKGERKETDNVDNRNISNPSIPNLDSFSTTQVNAVLSSNGETITSDSCFAVPGSSEHDSLDSFPVEEHVKHDLGSTCFDVEQGSMSLECQIDAENRARLQQMSPDEIAEAQSEIMEKMKPGLLETLKRRGQKKLGKRKTLTSELDTGCHPGILDDENHLKEELKSAPPLSEEGKTSHVSGTPSGDAHSDGGMKTLGTPNNNLWNAWSERVEAIRTLRFSLDGTVLENNSVQIPSTGNIPDQHNVGNVTERDFLRTEGDPAAVGYTIKEAVALSRSMVPGQRALALQLLASVLDKAHCNLQQSQVDCNMRNASNIDSLIDWKAVWAFALGPEPELALSLRMTLDDNHISVVLASLKVIHCILSCDINEKFFDISEKLATYQKDLYTAPVFRSRPEIDVGFLHGGFWKYNTKPSNVLALGDGMIDGENKKKHTIQDDITVAGQDFGAGMVRMGILPRVLSLLETDPTSALEEYLISILIGLARHSPTCANAIFICPGLVQTVVDRFTKKDTLEIHPSKIKSVSLLKVLAQSDRKNCIYFIEKGIFRDMMWHLYRYSLPLDHWVKSGKEYCKLTSALMIEQLRLWKVCIQYGYCISYYADYFPALCLWLSPPTFEKLIETNVLGEFASITREAYLVMEALARKLPNLHSEKQLRQQTLEVSNRNMETWSWSHVCPMVELALKWMSLMSNPYLAKIFDWNKGTSTECFVQDSSMSCFLWVISAVMHMLSSILKKITPEYGDSFHGNGCRVPWLPEFVPKIGLEIMKNRFLNFSGTDDVLPSVGGSLVEHLCYLRLHSDKELSLSSVCCLHGLIQLIVCLDNSIQAAKREICGPSSEGSIFSTEGKILEEGIITWSRDDLRSVLNTFMTLVSSGWHDVQSIETFGRGGPAPGVGMGWGASGGGFWSTTVLLKQTDAQLLMVLLKIFQIKNDFPTIEDMAFTTQRINSALGVCLTVGPRDAVIMEKALNFLLQAPALKYLDLCVQQFLINRGIKPFLRAYKEEDYLYISKTLDSHFRNRWLCVKRKSKVVVSNPDSDHMIVKKGGNALDTIYEDLDTSDVTVCDTDCTSLVMEWAHQRLPLPLHWFLSPISTNCDSRVSHNLSNASNIQNHMHSPSDEVLEVAKSGLFFLLGLEAMSSFPCTNVQCSPVHGVPLVWKLHSMSVVLLAGMGVLQEEKGRDLYETLQELYGQLLDESRCRSIKPAVDKNDNSLPETGKKYGVGFLKFQSDIHESYSTFIETLVEQYSAVSYGDVIYGRQLAMYLHCSVEVPVRIAAWNAFSNFHILELLPPLGKCFADVEGYLDTEDNEGILEAYVKSWISGGLDKAAARGSMTFALALHHLSTFIFHNNADDKSLLRNKLSKSLLRDYSRKPQHEVMILDLIQYSKPATEEDLLQTNEMERRFELLTEACEGNSSLLDIVEKLKHYNNIKR